MQKNILQKLGTWKEEDLNILSAVRLNGKLVRDGVSKWSIGFMR